MGIAESKLLVASVSRACNEAEKNDGLSQSKNILSDPLVQSLIKNSLSNPQVASYAASIWKSLPVDARNKITGHERSTQRTIKRAVTLSPDLKEFLNKCKRRPSYFFEKIGRKFELCFAFAQCYLFLSDTKCGGRVKRIVFLVIFARLKARLGHSRLHTSAREIIVSSLLRSGLVDDDALAIDRNFGEWASRGERYEALAAAFGGLDSLTVLPDDISDTFWEKRLPKSGTAHDKMIETLHQQGVGNFAGELGDVSILEDIIGYIWPHLEEEINAAMRQHRSSIHRGETAHARTPDTFYCEEIAHAPTPVPDGFHRQQSPHIPTTGQNIFHHGGTTAHISTPHPDGFHPQQPPHLSTADPIISSNECAMQMDGTPYISALNANGTFSNYGPSYISTLNANGTPHASTPDPNIFSNDHPMQIHGTPYFPNANGTPHASTPDPNIFSNDHSMQIHGTSYFPNANGTPTCLNTRPNHSLLSTISAPSNPTFEHF
ncbi:hypothetical protein EMCG_07320 [[Emmonsia] crescens]|uniref:Uncharacterized protein n=1 Tax=[Emmonsia] crescens TaxID=73230 RepID=A0A0G2J5R8_9EURO|nr:hypothetical protein EMCG_07320 [Emmonsia crescens UAMH 3008]